MLHSLNSGQHKPSALFDSSLALSEIPINWPKCLQGVFVWECGENAIMFSSLCLDVFWVHTSSSILLWVWEVVKLYFNGLWTISQHPQSVLMTHDILHAEVIEKEMPNDAVWRARIKLIESSRSPLFISCVTPEVTTCIRHGIVKRTVHHKKSALLRRVWRDGCPLSWYNGTRLKFACVVLGFF